MAPADTNAWRRDRPLNVARAGGDLEAPEHTLYACQQALAAGADALHLDLRLTGDDLHASGMALFVHGVDEEPAMERCLELGVDGIVTGRPSLLAGVLDR